jgi:DNA (cytosine-5)-methyltransferase 1
MRQVKLFSTDGAFSEKQSNQPSDKPRKKESDKNVFYNHHPVTLSLFSGAGGLDIGFHKAGFKIIACVEIERDFCDTLRLNLGKYSDKECRVINKDIREVGPEELAALKIDFIVGGPPCQSFSAIGRRAGGVDGVQDARGSLFEHYCRLVEYFQPEGFLFENVRGILGANKGKDWQRIVQAFGVLGYQLTYRILDCADYGVPQHRERLIMVGTKDNGFKFPRPTCGPDSLNQAPYVTARQAIANLQDPNESVHSYNGKYGKLLEEVPPGQNYHYFTKEMGYSNPIFAWRSRFSDFLYKADPDMPVRTIVAQLGAYSGPFHWKNRKFTLAEFKRLQTFPDDYDFAGGLNTALKQIGNSVPPKFAEQVAMAVLQQVFKVNVDLLLIENDDRLSFDSRKSKKAKTTRLKRASASNGVNHTPLFGVTADDRDNTKHDSKSHKTFYYLSPKHRAEVQTVSTKLPGAFYSIQTRRKDGTCTIKVSRYKQSKLIKTPLLRYVVSFHHPVGKGLSKIDCTLLSDSPADIPVAWDAIEDCLSGSAGYQSMMDVYGHFTEPHPIFELSLEIYVKQSSFLLRFAKMFSSFEATSKVLPERILEELYGDDIEEPFNLAEVARHLRELRFDVRVNETNTTIPQKHFRCCYPFTTNINKQVSVAWRETKKGLYAGAE